MQRQREWEGEERWREGGRKQGRRERNDTEMRRDRRRDRGGMTRTEGKRGKCREVERDKAGRGWNSWA